MSVVLRCPNCGTTRATPGECEACREAQVRYFCTNHTPGLWLDEPTCAQCGARFGERAREPAPATPARPKPPPARKSTPALRRIPARIPARIPTSAPGTPAADLPRPLDPESSGEEPELSLILAPWQKALIAGLRARRSALATREPGSSSVGLGGCLRRVVVTIVLLLVAFVTALFLFGRSRLQGFQTY